MYCKQGFSKLPHAYDTFSHDPHAGEDTCVTISYSALDFGLRARDPLLAFKRRSNQGLFW